MSSGRHETTADLVRRILLELGRRKETLAVAESLTGGLLSSSVVDVPGASASYIGGAVTYATRTKHSVLGVDAELLERCGPVCSDVAREMATGASVRFDSDWALATTGVAGPDDTSDGLAGTVYVAVAGPEVTDVTAHRFAGDRRQVREQAVWIALELLRKHLKA